MSEGKFFSGREFNGVSPDVERIGVEANQDNPGTIVVSCGEKRHPYAKDYFSFTEVPIAPAVARELAAYLLQLADEVEGK